MCDSTSYSVPHEFKVAIGRDEGKDTLLLITSIPYARVEGAVINDLGILEREEQIGNAAQMRLCLLYTSPSPRDVEESRMPSSA